MNPESPRTDDAPPSFRAAEIAEAYVRASGLGESDLQDALAVATGMAMWLEARGLPGRWTLLDGKQLGADVRGEPRERRMLIARHGGGMLLHLVRRGDLSAVRALTLLRNFRFGLRTCDGARRILDAQRQLVRDLILERSARADTAPRTTALPSSRSAARTRLH